MTDILATPKTFAVVIPTTWNVPTPWSVDVNLMVQGFLNCGHETVLICEEGSNLARATIERSRIHAVPRSRMAETDFWQTMGVDAALIFTWMGHADVVRAARKAGLFVISLSDSDGLHGVRVHPMATLARMVYPMPTLVGKMRGFWHWSKKVAYLHRQEEGEFLQTFQAAHVTSVQMSEGRLHLQHFLRYCQCAESEAKIQVVPFPICFEALNGSIGSKQDHLVAVGRWDDPQKNAKLMERSLREFLRRSPDTHVTLIGRGGETVFAPLLRMHKQARYAGVLPRPEVTQILQTARTILFTSRWEGMPIALQEALALGCSFVGTDIPAMRSAYQAGPFGTLAASPRPHAVADALEAERVAWQSGKRDPLAIADFWRSRLSPQSTAQMYIDLLAQACLPEAMPAPLMEQQSESVCL